MLARAGFVLGLISPFLMAAAAVVSAGEAAPPPPKVGETVNISDQNPQGSVTGWVRWHRGPGLCLCVEQISGEKRRPGDDFEIWVRDKVVEGKDKPQHDGRELALFRLFKAGDRVEATWLSENKRVCAVSIRLLAQFPREGTLAGKVVKLDERNAEAREWFDLLLPAPPQGFDYLKGQSVRVNVPWINSGDEKKGRRGWIPNPEHCKALGTLQEGDLLEVAYKADLRLRLESLRKTGHVEPERKTEREGSPERGRKPKDQPKSGDPEPD